MSKKAPKPKETPGSSNDDERQRKRDKGKELFAAMAKIMRRFEDSLRAQKKCS